MQAMQDPSQGIQRDLLPHVHLLSTYRFPITPANLHPERVAEWLLQAPKIAREQAPVYWTYLDRPVDGTVLMGWQSPSLGNEYPSDGYIWAPGEHAMAMEIMGHTLEIYHCKTGYAPGEPLAIHSRRRYRLVPPRIPNQNAVPDPNLWIIHYTQSAPEDRIPSNVIPIDMRVQHILSTRQYLHQQGQLIHKEFMLYDRSGWPSIEFPRGRPRGAQMYAGNMPARVPQTMAYPTHAQPGPPSKRARTQQAAQAQAQAQAAAAAAAAANNAIPAVIEGDEEDTHYGDMFDLTTPREISYSRFQQNHNWMEEVLASPYAIGQIVPADLGLGVRGELSGLTEGIFDAPTKENEESKLNYVGRLDPEKADEFRKRAHERIAQTNKEMEHMKAKHAKRLAKFQKGSLIAQAEKDLRTAVDNPEDIGPEYWRLEGKADDEKTDDSQSPVKTPLKVDDVLAKVEASLGRHAVAIQELCRIQDGGYEEAVARPSPPPQPSRHDSQQSGVLINETDAVDADVDMSNSVDMGNSAAGLLDQYHTASPSNATPGSGNYPTPGHLQHPSTSAANTPTLNLASPNPAQSMGTPQPEQSIQSIAHEEQQDIHMQDAVSTADTQPSVSAPAPAPATSADTSDWVVIPPGGVSPTTDPSNTASNQNVNTEPNTLQPSSAAHSATTPDYLKPSTTSDGNNIQQQHHPTGDFSLPDQTHEHAHDSQHHQQPTMDLNENDFDLEDLDTAGDALASYDGGDGGMGGMGEGDHDHDHGLDDLVDDSAFGEAFHGVDHGHGDGDGDGVGM